MSAPANFNALWARAVAQELCRAGVQLAVACPGSRSAPLALALAEQPGLSLLTVLDERSAAFVALGAAKATGRPAVVLATSGSAGAHFHPAVLEAEASAVPLVALTADRPPELHGFGAPQTCDQQRLFGEHVRAFADLGAPEPSEAALLHLRASVALALSRALGPRRGPVHLNAPFREPLAPLAGPLPQGLSARALQGPGIAIAPGRVQPERAQLDALARELSQRPRGVIVCGPRDAADALPSEIAVLAEALGYAVLADAASGLRASLPQAIGTADLLLRDETLARALRPEAVIRIGGGLTSKVLQGWLDSASAYGALLCEDGALFDPQHAASLALCGDAAAICAALAQPLREAGARPGPLAKAFARADALARGALEQAFARDDGPLSEPRAAREVAAALPGGAQLFVSSSMPVRDLDAFAPSLAGVRVLASRGLNGIDGIVSTALGAAAGTGAPTAVLLGDVALLHDLSGLVAARGAGTPLVAVVVNNDGGGIFHFLPIAQHAEPARFEQLFGTPHGLDLEGAALLCGATLHRPRTAAALRAAVRESAGRGLHLVEVRTERGQNVQAHRALQQAVLTVLGGQTWD